MKKSPKLCTLPAGGKPLAFQVGGQHYLEVANAQCSWLFGCPSGAGLLAWCVVMGGFKNERERGSD